ncbi:MAG: SMC-Scp complex subunit ScpB [Actinomycetales bacterium]|nr:SMC-Scp complex subunit ScpB [Actinomycetales bacterium]
MSEQEQAAAATDVPDAEPAESEQPQGFGAPTLAAALEALVLIADEPVPVTALAEVTNTPVAVVETELNRLAEQYTEQGRGFALRQSGGGWRLYTRDTCADAVTRWVKDGQRARLSQAAMETLAIIAYKQPITRARIASVRGVNVDGVVRTLLARGLVAEVGVEPTSQASLYSTTELFLERMGIADLESLPDIAPLLPDIDDAVDLFDSMNA